MFRPFVVVLLVSGFAHAYRTGIVGFSGAGGSNCNFCHGGGARPTVKLQGPSTLQAGAVGTYTLTITGGAGVIGGLDVSVDNPAAQLQAGGGLQVFNNEITHTQPAPFSNGSVTFTFTLTAPSSSGNVALHGAGNSCNGDGSNQGDFASDDQFFVAIQGAGSDGGIPVFAAVSTDGGEVALGPEAGGCAAAPWGPCTAGLLALLARRPRGSRRRRSRSSES